MDSAFKLELEADRVFTMAPRVYGPVCHINTPIANRLVFIIWENLS